MTYIQSGDAIISDEPPKDRDEREAQERGAFLREDRIPRWQVTVNVIETLARKTEPTSVSDMGAFLDRSRIQICHYPDRWVKAAVKRLQAAELVEGVPGQGYKLTELGRELLGTK